MTGLKAVGRKPSIRGCFGCFGGLPSRGRSGNGRRLLSSATSCADLPSGRGSGAAISLGSSIGPCSGMGAGPGGGGAVSCEKSSASTGATPCAVYEPWAARGGQLGADRAAEE